MEYGLIGRTLGHSYSPKIHSLIGGYSYELVSLTEEALDRFLREKNFKGINVTIPYKKAVIPYCSGLSSRAKRIGSVNTIVNRGGVLDAYNTDYDGFLYMAERAGISFAGGRVAILGSGGTHLTASAVAEDMGAADIITVSRRGPVTYEMLRRDYRNCDILINTTPVGMYPDVTGCPVSLADFTNLRGVLDVIYNPAKTVLARQAEALGIPCSCGLPMLIMQAVRASELFFDVKYPSDMPENIYETFLNHM